MTCDGSSSSEGVLYRFKVWQNKAKPADEIEIELGCNTDPEAYVMALKFLTMIGYAIFRAQLLNWKGQHMMYYSPKNGWVFGDHRDHTPF